MCSIYLVACMLSWLELVALSSGENDLREAIARLDDKNPSVRKKASEVILDTSEASPNLVKVHVPKITAALNDQNSDVRLLLLTSLNNLGGAVRNHADILLPETAKFLYDEKYSTAFQCAKVLSKIGTPAVPTLMKELKAPKVPARSQLIVECLGWIGPGSRNAIPIIEQKLDLAERGSITKFLIAEALLRIDANNAAAASTMGEWLGSKDAEIRINAACALARTPKYHKEVLPVFLTAIEHQKDFRSYFNSLFAIWRIDGDLKLAVPTLEKALSTSMKSDDPTRNVLCAAALLRADSANKKAKEVLTKNLDVLAEFLADTQQREVRLFAIEVLSAIECRSLKTRIETLRDDDESEIVREAAERILKRK